MSKLFVTIAVVASIGVVALGLRGRAADSPPTKVDEAHKDHKDHKEATVTGTVEGVITYRADSARPWRLSRYYIKDRKTGCLAEAVVALDGAGTKAAKPAPQPATVTIDQKDFQFVPETVAICAGDRVTFKNSDRGVHNVHTVHELGSFNVNMPPGGKHTETFKHAGGIHRPYRIGCVYHGSMRAWVYVFEHAFFQITAADGRFRLNGVPKGRYKLEVTHPAGRLGWSKQIEVKAGQTTRVDIVLTPDNRQGAKH